MKQKKIILVRIYFVALCVIYGLIIVCAPLYNSGIDNYLISHVLNGSYDIDNYCSYVNPFLAWFIRLLESIYSGADYYVLIQMIFVFLGVVWLLRCLAYLVLSKKKFVLLSLIIVGVASLYDLAHVNFTVAATYFTIIGFISLVWTAKEAIGKNGCLVGTLFVCLGVIWRKGSFMLCMPFFILVVAIDFIYIIFKRKNNINKKRIIFTFLPAFILVTGLYMAHLNVNTWDGYSEGVKYNSARSKVTDYLLAEYSEIKEELDNLGVSENDYESIQKLVLADTDNITDEYMNSVAEVSQTNISFVRAVKRVFWSVIERGAWVFNFLCIIELVLLLWCMCLDIEKCEKFKIILAWVGAFIMLIYFQYIGRAPERIYVSLLFAVNFVEFTVLHKDVKTVAAFESVIRKLGTLAACSVLVAALYQVTKSIYVFPQNPFLADRNADVTKYRDILDSNNTYVWSVFSFKSIIVADFMEQGKLIPEEILNCNIVDGEWTYGQVYYNNYLKNIGIENPMEALLYGKNMFYVSDSDRCDLILTYLKEHYDETVQAVQMGEIENVKIWRFFVSEKNVGDSTVT